MSGKDRRDTYLTVNFPADGYTSIGPNAHVNTVKLPMEHLQQVLQIPAGDMDEQLKGVTLHDATHASADGESGFNILMEQGDGSSVEPFPADDRHYHLDSHGNVGCHHFVVSNGSFPEPTRNMGRNFISKSSNKEMQAKLKNLGVHTAGAMKDIHQGLQRIEGTDSKGNQITKISVDAGHAIRKVLEAADKEVFKGAGYSNQPTSEPLIMEEAHVNKVLKDLKDATEDTKVHENPFIGATHMVFHKVHHGDSAPEGSSNATFGFSIEGDKQAILPVTKSADGSEIPAPTVPGMKQVTNVRPLEPKDISA